MVAYGQRSKQAKRSQKAKEAGLEALDKSWLLIPALIYYKYNL